MALILKKRCKGTQPPAQPFCFTIEDRGLFDRSCHDKYVFKMNIRVQRYNFICVKRSVCVLKVTNGGLFSLLLYSF